MKKYTRKFYGRILLFAGGFAALATLFMQTMFDRIKIEHDRSVLMWFYLLPVLYALAVSGFTFLMARRHTNILRRYEFSVPNEKAFYIIFAAVIVLMSAGETGFMMMKLLPFLEKALTFALKDAEIKNETPEMREQIIAAVRARYAGYRTAAFVGAGAVLVIRSVCAGLSVPKLILVYRNPPDFWSGKKKNKD